MSFVNIVPLFHQFFLYHKFTSNYSLLGTISKDIKMYQYQKINGDGDKKATRFCD